MTSALYRAAYRLTLYAPRSEQPDPVTEVGVLYPRAGALHGDAFRVWTLPTGRGWKGYLLPPKGRKSALSLRERKADSGTMVAEILDKRLGSSNSERWFSQYLTSASGESRVHSCLGIWEESLDGGDTWAPYFTGRVKAVQQSSRQVWQLQFRDLVEDWKRDIFVGPPSSAVTSYANIATLIPHHNVHDFHNIYAHEWAPGRIRTTLSGVDGSLELNNGAPYDRWCIVSKALAAQGTDTASFAASMLNRTAFAFEIGRLRVHVRNPATSAEGVFNVATILTRNDTLHAIAQFVNLVELDPAEEGYATWASIGATNAQVEAILYATGALEGQHAVMINDVHPIQLLADLADGHFGRLKADGTPMFTVRRDASAGVWATMLADTTWGSVSFIQQEGARFSDWIQEHLCKPLGLAIAQSADGYLIPIDLRPATPSGLSTITDDDVVADSSDESWTQDAGGAVNVVRYDYWGDFPQSDFVPSRDQADFPDSRPGLIQSIAVAIEQPGSAANLIDMGVRPLKIEADGLRYSPDYISIGNSANALAAQNRARRLAGDWLDQYSRGARTLTLACRRTAVPTATTPGTMVLIDVSTVLSPDTMTYGGLVQARCVSREERGPVLVLGFELMAVTVVADPPTIGTPTLGPSTPSGETVDAVVTLNTDGEPAEAMYAVTATSVAVRPVDTDPAWTGWISVFATGTQRWASLPAGRRIWVRARTRPSLAGGLKQPSAWVYPSGTEYVDTVALSAPTGLAVSNITAQTADVSWAGGLDGWAYQVLHRTGTSLINWLDSEVIATLNQPPRAYTIGGNSASTNYVVGVRFIDQTGRPGPVAAVAYTSTSTAAVAPRLAGMDILYWSHVELTVYPGDTSYDIEVERAPDLAGAPDTANSVTFLIPRHGYFFDFNQPDYTTYWYRARHVLTVAGVTPGPWLAWMETQARPRQGGGGGGGPPLPPWQDPSQIIVPAPIAPVLPTVNVAQSASAGTGSCTVTVTDPQQRVTAVEFQTFDGSTTSAWIADPSIPYSTTVGYTSAAMSKIRYRLIGYDAAGASGQVLLSGEVAFGGPALAHATTHQNGGTDEINVAGLSGVLDEEQDAGWFNGIPVNAPAPADGDTLVYDAGAGEWVSQAPTGGGGGGSRATVSKTTASLAHASSETGTITLAKSGTLIAITVDRACRVQLYATSAARTTDIARAFGVPVPATSQGVIIDYQATGAGSFVFKASPGYANGDGAPSTSLYYRITNRSGATSTVAVDLVHVGLET